MAASNGERRPGVKASRIYAICMVVLLLGVFALEHFSPKKFVWIPTFSQYDHQPFGSAVFDDVLSSSLKSFPAEAYSVTNQTFYQLSQDSVSVPHILSVSESLMLTDVDREAVLGMLERGSKILLVSGDFDKELQDTLGFKISSGYFVFSNWKAYVSSSLQRDTLRWYADSLYTEHSFYSYPQLCKSYFYESDSLFKPLAGKLYNEETDRLVAITGKVGMGELTLVSTPLLFTNYGMLDPGNADYLFRLLTTLNGSPIVRTEAYGVNRKASEDTPLRYLLSQQPLKWGLYLTLLLILIFMIFTARRQQRPIPIIRKPDNKAVEFVRLIGTLYYQRKDHTDLVCKKFTYFAELLRRNLQIDIENEENDNGLAKRMALKIGMDEDRILRFLQHIRPVVRGEERVDESQMKEIIKEINEIISHIK